MLMKAMQEALKALRTVVQELEPMMAGHADALRGCDAAEAELAELRKAARVVREYGLAESTGGCTWEQARERSEAMDTLRRFAEGA